MVSVLKRLKQNLKKLMGEFNPHYYFFIDTPASPPSHQRYFFNDLPQVEVYYLWGNGILFLEMSPDTVYYC